MGATEQVPLMPKTIQIFLPHGDPRGIRVAEVTTRIVQAVAVPRTDLSAALAREEAKHVAVYFLVGNRDDASKPVLYVGQTEDLATRLKDHNAKKDFWQTAVFVISRTHRFTQGHIRYLEWYAIQQAREAGRYVLDNSNEGSKPFVTEPMEADLMDAFDTAKTLLGALGFPLFDPVTKAPAVSSEAEVFYCTGPNTEASGELVQDGFAVFKGSVARFEVELSAGTAVENMRRKLMYEGIMVECDGQFVLEEDVLFSSPSLAACAMLGNSTNGWTTWRRKDGKTLHDVYRAKDDEAAQD